MASEAGISSGIGVDVGPASITKKFVASIPTKRLTTLDEKYISSLSSWGVQDQRLAFFFKLCRGLERPALQTFVKDVVAEAIKRGQDSHPTDELQGYVDLFVIAFQTRDITEGKGERKLFYLLLIELSKYFPKTVLASLPLIAGKYGSWKDVLLLLEIVKVDLSEAEGAFQLTTRQKQLASLQEALLTLMCNKLVDDDKTRGKILQLRTELETAKQANAKDTVTKLYAELQNLKVSLCGKWAPREKSHFSSLAKEMAVRIFGDSGVPSLRQIEQSLQKAEATATTTTAATATSDGLCVPPPATVADLKTKFQNAKYRCYKQYRQLVARLNKFSKTCEVFMCDARGQWDQLNPAAIPARCLKINRKAFMNQTSKGEARSTRSDRVKCAERFVAHLTECVKNPTKAKVHGKNLMPHEIVKHYYQSGRRLNDDDLTLEAQWVDLRTRLKESGSLGNFVPMVDVSGSMEGTPMIVAIALGILVSECTHPTFQNRFLTFDSTPEWHVLKGDWSLREKVQSTADAAWGGSTNFFRALQLILDACTKGKVPVKDVQEMTFCIFSDMQFSDADDNLTTKYEQIAREFKAAGYADPETGEAIVPRMLFWNLRGDTVDFPARADAVNCDMVSGFSANGLKAFMAGDVLETAVENPPTPYDGMRKQLDDERYDSVRLLCEATGEIVSRSNGASYRAPERVEPEEKEAETPSATAGCAAAAAATAST